MGDYGAYGFYPAAREGEPGPLVAVERAGEGWAIVVRRGGESLQLALPAAFDAGSFQQIRALVQGGRAELSWEGLALDSIALPERGDSLGLWAGGGAAFDIVRVTALPTAG